MKNLAITLLVGVFLALFTWWLNQDRVDVRFTLSERVPVSFGGATNEAVQQIEVRNVGRKTAERIQVKIESAIVAYEVIKQSAADRVEEFRGNKGLELVYSLLPSDGTFRVVFKTVGEGVARDKVQVRHEKGSATYALGSSSPWGLVLTISQVLFLVSYLYLTASAFRENMISRLGRSGAYKSEELLKRQRPWLVKREEWAELRSDALKRFAYESVGHDAGDIETSAPLRRLDLDRIDFLSIEEQYAYRVAATESVLAQINARVCAVYSSERLRPFLAIRRPAHVQIDKWQEMHTALVEKYLTKRVEEVRHGGELDRLREERPVEIGAREWEASQKRISDQLFTNLSVEIERSSSPFTIAESDAALALPEGQLGDLKKRAYRAALRELPDVTYPHLAPTFLKAPRPTWISDRDYERFQECAERSIENDALKKIFNRIANRLPVDGSDLEGLSSDLRGRIVQMDQQIRIQGKRIDEEADRISSESAKLKSDRETVLKQLAILNSIFSDPKSVDRIEDYDNPFAPGNFENLKRVAKAIQAAS